MSTSPVVQFPQREFSPRLLYMDRFPTHSLLLQPEYHIFMVAGTTRSVYERLGPTTNQPSAAMSHHRKRLGRFDEAEARETLASIKL